MANNVIIPASGVGTSTPTVETIDTTGSGGAQRQVFRQGKRLNPSSTLTRAGGTLTYVQGAYVAAASGVPNFSAALLNNMSGVIKRIRMSTNATSGMDGIILGLDLWTAVPAFSATDGQAYGLSSGGTPGISTGSANWLARIPSIVLNQAGDGAFGDGLPDAEVWFLTGASSTLISWSLFTQSGFAAVSAQTFTLTAEILQD